MPSSRCHNTGLLRGLPVRSLSLLSLALLSLALMACGDGPTVVREVDTLVRTVDVQGSSRSYWLYVSASAAASPSTPLLLVFHGATQTASGAALMSWLYPLADAEGLIVADPQATGDYWNTPPIASRGIGTFPTCPSWTRSSTTSTESSVWTVPGFMWPASPMGPSSPRAWRALGATGSRRWPWSGRACRWRSPRTARRVSPYPRCSSSRHRSAVLLVGRIRRRIGHAGRGGQCPVVGHEQRMPTSADHDRSAAPGRRWHVRRAVGLCRVRSR